MAFNAANLTFNSTQAFASHTGVHFWLWEYETTDSVADTKVSGYWNAAGRTLRDGDFVAVTCNDGKYFGPVSANPDTPSAAVTDWMTVSSFAI